MSNSPNLTVDMQHLFTWFFFIGLSAWKRLSTLALINTSILITSRSTHPSKNVTELDIRQRLRDRKVRGRENDRQKMTWKHFKNNVFRIQYLPSSHPCCTSPASPHGLMALRFCSDLDLSQYFWPLLHHLVQVPYRALLISSPKEFSISPFPPTPPILPWFKRWSALSWSTKETFWLSSLQFPHQQKGEKKITIWELWVVLFGGKMRTVAWETASQGGLRNYFKLLQRGRGKGQYTCVGEKVSIHVILVKQEDIQSGTHSCRSFLLVLWRLLLVM